MKRKDLFLLVVIYLILLSVLILIGFYIDRSVTTFCEYASPTRSYCIVIDAGHGGVDGGTTSCTGVLESSINLDIAIRLNDLFHFLGHDTIMIRSDDRSVHTEGETIASKKVSDLKQRVKIVSQAINPVYVGIHQNHFADSKYSGAQVFYAINGKSEELAVKMQSAIRQTLNPTSRRQSKKGTGIYIMEKIQCPGILVECGFLSNPQEEALLRDAEYQKKLCCVIATEIGAFVSEGNLDQQ